jgi:hypothetical protein
MKLEDIATEASKLSEEERASLASRLLHGLESPVYEVSDAEISERVREAENDTGVWLTFDELVSGLKRRAS